MRFPDRVVPSLLRNRITIQPVTPACEAIIEGIVKLLPPTTGALKVTRFIAPQGQFRTSSGILIYHLQDRRECPATPRCRSGKPTLHPDCVRLHESVAAECRSFFRIASRAPKIVGNIVLMLLLKPFVAEPMVLISGSSETEGVAMSVTQSGFFLPSSASLIRDRHCGCRETRCECRKGLVLTVPFMGPTWPPVRQPPTHVRDKTHQAPV